MKNKLLLLMLAFICSMGMWADTMSVDFEATDLSTYSTWEFSNFSTHQTNSNVSAHGGSYFGSCAATSAYAATKATISSPTSIVCYYSKLTTNTNATSLFKIQVSSNGTDWTDVASGKTMNNVTRGTWEELSADLTSYSNVYVRVFYTGTNAGRTIDDIVLTYSTSGGSTPETTKYNVTVATDIANGTVTANPASAAEGATVTLTADPVDGYMLGSWNVTNASTNETITVTDNQFTMPDADVNVSATFVQIPEKTIADFISSKGGKCYLTGIVSNLATNNYGNFDLTDETGTIYVYGCLTPAGEKQKFNTLGVIAGDKIKVLANDFTVYNEKNEAVDVIFVEEIEIEKAQYTVTIETPENGTLVVKEGENVITSGDKVEEGKTLNITATPNRGYSFRNWQAVDGSTHTYTTTFTHTVSADVTIKANFDEIAKYTVTLADDNTELTPEYGGEVVVLPSREDTNGYTFAGWSETNVTEETTTTPIIIEAGDYNATANITLYPVYKRSEGHGERTVSVNVAEYANAHDWTVLASGTATKETHCKYEIDIDSNVKVTTNDNNVNGAVYSDGWRIYQSYNGAVTVTTTAGSLSSVKFTYGNANGGQLFYGEDQLTSATAKEVTGTTATFNVIRTTDLSKTNGQVKITAIEVTYIDGTTYYISVPPTPVPTFASLDELIAANIEEPTVVNVTLNNTVLQAMNMGESNIVYIDNNDDYVVLSAPGSDLGWEMGGTVCGTLNNVTWDGMNYAITSETDFWSSLTYTAPAGAPTETITLNAACHDKDGMVYGTYSSANAWYVPEDLIVSEISIVNGKLNVKSYETSDLVPPYTGVMVSATDGGNYEVSIETDYDMWDLAESVLGEDNALRPTCFKDGILAEDMAAENPGCLFYRLTMHNGSTIGYWWGAENGAAFNLAANKAYLAVPTTSGTALANGFTFESDITTLIDAVKNTEKANGVAYNLNGQRVSANTKGIVIINGHKYINK